MLLSRSDALVIGDIVAAAAWSEIMPRFSGIQSNAVREKLSAFDIVTDADEAVEREIAAGLSKAFSSTLIIGEEAAEKARQDRDGRPRLHHRPHRRHQELRLRPAALRRHGRGDRAG
jgi:fructose-1,6-bisphosphatase/inositol monophosphatase family enzyme